MSKEYVPPITINDYNDCTLITVNTNVSSSVEVATGRRGKSTAIICTIIVGVLITVGLLTLTVIFVKRNSSSSPPTTTTEETTKIRITVTYDQSNILFTEQNSYSTGVNARPVALAVSDVNYDGKPDIIVANQYGYNVGVLLNSGNGIFSPIVTYSTKPYSDPQCVSVVDINGDDKPDIIVANNRVSNVGILFNSGNGTFRDQITYSTGHESYPSSIVVADVNGDRKPDIIVANHNVNNIGILFNFDNGKFTSQITYPLAFGTAPVSLSVADVNGDSKPDIIFANYDENTIGILFNIGNGRFIFQGTYSTGFDSRPRYLSVVDVNQDDKVDIVVANSNKNNVGVFLNSGNGAFLDQTTYSTGEKSEPRCVSVVDINSDNKPDIIVANYNEHNIGILINIGNGTFILEKQIPTGSNSYPQFVSVIDVNDDNKMDIIVANSNQSTVGVILAL